MTGKRTTSVGKRHRSPSGFIPAAGEAHPVHRVFQGAVALRVRLADGSRGHGGATFFEDRDDPCLSIRGAIELPMDFSPRSVMPRCLLPVVACLLIQPLQAITFSPLPWIPGESPYSEAWGVSGDGSTVVGSVPSGPQNYVRPVRWTEGILEILPLPASSAPGSGPAGQGLGISGDGSVVVGTFAGRAFHWSQDTGSSSLGTLSTTTPYSGARAVSSDGTHVYGQTNDPRGAVGYVWTASGGMESMGRMPGPYSGATSPNAANGDGSVVVGSAEVVGTPSRIAVIWSDGRLSALPSPPGEIIYSDAYDISGRFIAGSALLDGPWPRQTHAVVWDLHNEFAPRILASPEGARQTIADAISANGVVAGGQSIIGDKAHAVLWDQLGNLHYLAEQLESAGLETEGWQFLGVTGISDDGLTLVGNGINPEGISQAWIIRDFQFVPEPGGFSLLMMASGILLGIRRRDRSSAGRRTETAEASNTREG